MLENKTIEMTYQKAHPNKAKRKSIFGKRKFDPTMPMAVLISAMSAMQIRTIQQQPATSKLDKQKRIAEATIIGVQKFVDNLYKSKFDSFKNTGRYGFKKGEKQQIVEGKNRVADAKAMLSQFQNEFPNINDIWRK